MQQIYLMPEDGIHHLLEKLNNLEATIHQQQHQIIQQQWLDNEQLMALLNVSKRTLQNWRDCGYIAFSQIGNKIYYRFSDVESMLQANSNSAFRIKNLKEFILRHKQEQMHLLSTCPKAITMKILHAKNPNC